MKITKEILRDYKDFRIERDNKFMKEFSDGRIDYAECPFCESGGGAVEYSDGMLVCRVCNYWWSRRFPIALKYAKGIGWINLFVGFTMGFVLAFLILHLIGK